MRTATGLSWLVGDQHPTAEVAITATTLAVAKRRTLPYGDTRGSLSGSWPTGMDKGFLGGTNDPTGLTHLGARDYDPTTGRFTSVDPITDVNSPQQINGYTYANGSPTAMTDPSGRRPACDDDSGNGVHACQTGEQGYTPLYVVSIARCPTCSTRCRTPRIRSTN